MGKSFATNHINCRLCNFIFINFAIGEIAKKNSLAVEYVYRQQTEDLGIVLYHEGTCFYDDHYQLTDENYFVLLHAENLDKNVMLTHGFLQMPETAKMLSDKILRDKDWIIGKNKFRSNYNTNSDVFIHLRLGDVEHNNPGFNYYDAALQKIGNNYSKGFLCTDTPNHEIVQQIIAKYPNIIILNGLNEVDTIHFGSTCKYVVLSHGSFSAMIGYFSFFSQIYFPEYGYGGKQIWYADIFLHDKWNVIREEKKEKKMKKIPNDFFYIKNKDTYPPFKNGLYLEEYFLKHQHQHHEQKHNGRVYIPALWTNFQIDDRFNQMKSQLQESLNKYVLETPSENGYFTLVQYDDGPLLELPPNTIVYGACSGDVPLPLIYEDLNNTLEQIEKIPFEQKTMLCSFVGTATHDVRRIIHGALQNNPDFVFFQRNGWSPVVQKEQQELFIDVTKNSKFALAPRGYGRSSFRFFEIFKLGSVPVYVWDDAEWLPYKDEVDYSKICVSIHISKIGELDAILKGISAEKYAEMLAEYERIKHVFGLEYMCEWIVSDKR
jgi:hypothetical protein